MDMDTDLRAIYSVIIKFYIMELITVMTFMLHPITKESLLDCENISYPVKAFAKYQLCMIRFILNITFKYEQI